MLWVPSFNFVRDYVYVSFNLVALVPVIRILIKFLARDSRMIATFISHITYSSAGKFVAQNYLKNLKNVWELKRASYFVLVGNILNLFLLIDCILDILLLFN